MSVCDGPTGQSIHQTCLIFGILSLLILFCKIWKKVLDTSGRNPVCDVIMSIYILAPPTLLRTCWIPVCALKSWKILPIYQKSMQPFFVFCSYLHKKVSGDVLTPSDPSLDPPMVFLLLATDLAFSISSTCHIINHRPCFQ